MNIFSLLALVTAADLFPFFLVVSIASLVAFVTLLVWPRKKTNDQPQQTQTNEPKQVAEPFKPEILVGPDKQHIISGAPIEEPIEEPVEEPVVEPVVEPAPVEQPQVVVATVAKAENETDQGVMILEGKEVLVRYKRSFESKLMQSTEELKDYYAEFVNHALSYKKVKVKLSWPCAKISRSRDKIATLLVKGKTMYVYLALDPEVARQTIKGKIKDVSNKKRFQDVPTLFKVKSTLSLRKAKTLLDKVMETLAIDYVAPSSAISAETYPYDTTENLIKQGLIRVRTLDGSPIEDGDILRTAGFILGNPAKPQPVEEPQPEPVVEVQQPEVESDEGIMYIDDNEVLVRYNRSFTSKLMQSSDLLKGHYAELTNHALSYKKVKLRVSWPCAKLNCGRDNLAIITVRGKSLYLYLDMDPEVARQTIKGTIKDVSDKKRYQQTPTLFKIKSALALKRAKTLIDAMMQAKGIEFAQVSSEVSTEQFPYDTTENLIKAGLIKVRALDGREIEEGMILRAAGFSVGSIAPAKPVVAEPQIVEVPVAQEADSDDGIMLVDEQEILVRYNRSFTSKLMQASDLLKGHYAELANHALSHKKVKLRISWPCAKLNHGRENIITFTIRGKTLYMYLAMDPESARQVTKGTIKDVSDKKRYQATPSLFKIKSALALKRAKVLIDALMQQKGIAYVAPCADISAEQFPYDTTENLVRVGLIKVRTLDGREVEEGMILRAAGFKVVESVTAEEAHTMISDEVASTLVVVEEPTVETSVTNDAGDVVEVRNVSIKSLGARSGRKFAINIDTLSKHFQKGDRVTIEALKRKGLVPKKETAIKVLARGTLDKQLIVEAAAFSLDAIKMIVLVGGTAIRK